MFKCLMKFFGSRFFFVELRVGLGSRGHDHCIYGKPSVLAALATHKDTTTKTQPWSSTGPMYVQNVKLPPPPETLCKQRS